MTFKEKFEQLINKLPIKREGVRSLAISIVFALFFLWGHYLLGSHFAGTMWIIDMILWGILLLIIWILAGVAVLKSLFFVAAELSLLIFLAQSYCDVPSRSATSNEALKSLMFIGLLYITFRFFSSLYEALKVYYKKFENERWSTEKIVTVAFYLIFIGLFMWQIYQVVSPIILNLCIKII